jgi:hypothetical protein
MENQPVTRLDLIAASNNRVNTQPNLDGRANLPVCLDGWQNRRTLED